MTGKQAEKVQEKVDLGETKAHMMDVAAGTLSLELPNGYIDADGHIHYDIAVREMTGAEEDLLGGKGPVQPRMNKIISNCLVQFGGLNKGEFEKAVADLTANDRMVALMGIRRVSLGDFYDVRVICPNTECKAQSFFPINLSELEVVPMEDRSLRERTDAISTGKKITWHVMTAEDEAWLLKKQKKKEDMLTHAMLARIDSIDGVDLERDKHNGEKAISILKALRMRERNEIRELFRKNEGHVDIEVEFECPECGHEWREDMPIGQASFFFPSGR